MAQPQQPGTNPDTNAPKKRSPQEFETSPQRLKDNESNKHRDGERIYNDDTPSWNEKRTDLEDDESPSSVDDQSKY